MSDGWSPQRVDAFRRGFREFVSSVYINSKELGGHTCLGDHVYRAQSWFLESIFDALLEGQHELYTLKSRQLGVSTISRALSLFWLGVNPGLQGAFVFDTAYNTAAARREIINIISNLPPSLAFPRIRDNNRDALILENDSQILFMAAGVKQSRSAGGLGRSVGLNFCHCSELCSWNNDEGLTSFRQSLSETYPERLYLWESTARGFNSWHDMWLEAQDDDAKRTLFLGWWAKDNQIIRENTLEFYKYGQYQPTPSELKRINAVKERYDWEITAEQLAWYRKKSDPTQDMEEGDAEDSNLIQEQPWCLVAGSRVGTSEGIIPIEEVRSGMGATAPGWPSTQSLRAASNLGGTFCEVLRSGPTGTASVWRATTSLGYEVLGTGNHPLIDVDGHEREIQDSLGCGVRLQPPRFSDHEYSVRWKEGPVRSEVVITPDVARLVGIFMGDGTIQGGYRSNPSVFSVSIACDAKDRDFIAECSRLFTEIFSVNINYKHQDTRGKNGGDGCVHVRASSRMVVDTFRRLGLVRNDTGPTQRKVHVPEFIFRSPKIVVKQFLSGLFETDGFNDYSTHRCVLFTKYEQFSKDVQLLLLGFGITSRRRVATKKAGSGADYIGYEIQLRSSEAKKFNEEIGFLSARKCARAVKPNKPEGRRVGNYKAAAPITFVDNVVSVEKTDRVEIVYNLAVSDSHWFDANGILTHNTEDEAFQQSGASFFDTEVLTANSVRISSGPKAQTYKFIAGINKLTECDFQPSRFLREIELRIWEEPVTSGVYIVAGDPAFGHNEDNNNSCAQVLRCYADCIEQVAEYATAIIRPHQFAWLLWGLVGYYGKEPDSTVMTICELNGPGEEVWRQYQQTRQLIQQGYLRAEFEKKGLANITANARNYVFQRSDSMGSGHNYQWVTSTQRKIQILEAERGYLNSETFIPHSIELIEEMRTITREGDTIGAPGKKRDDRSFAAALGIRAWDEKMRRGLIASNRTREAEKARLSASILDQYALHNKYTLQSFLKDKETMRHQAATAALRQNWRSGIGSPRRQVFSTRRW